ncbi:MAG: 23S rRNA (guanosine(2251)-2'-O)-methyltransferase RlmB [Deltaproteobacteria bacterium]
MIIYGRKPVKEALLNPALGVVEEVLISEDLRGGGKIAEILTLAKAKSVRVAFVSPKSLDQISDGGSHQGIAARIPDFQYASMDDIFQRAGQRGENPLIAVLDHIEDPQNLGAIIRSANALGAHGVIIPKDRAAGVTAAAVKASAGAAAVTPVSRVVNLVSAMKELKRRGVWIVGADASASKSVFEEDLGKVALAVVVGNEGRGLGRLVREECDFIVSIPNPGEISSLNASVSAGIMIYEAARQRRVKIRDS